MFSHLTSIFYLLNGDLLPRWYEKNFPILTKRLFFLRPCLVLNWRFISIMIFCFFVVRTYNDETPQKWEDKWNQSSSLVNYLIILILSVVIFFIYILLSKIPCHRDVGPDAEWPSLFYVIFCIIINYYENKPLRWAMNKRKGFKSDKGEDWLGFNVFLLF